MANEAEVAGEEKELHDLFDHNPRGGIPIGGQNPDPDGFSGWDAVNDPVKVYKYDRYGDVTVSLLRDGTAIGHYMPTNAKWWFKNRNDAFIWAKPMGVRSKRLDSMLG